MRELRGYQDRCYELVQFQGGKLLCTGGVEEAGAALRKVNSRYAE